MRVSEFATSSLAHMSLIKNFLEVKHEKKISISKIEIFLNSK